jgi:hypothetical protein
MKIDGKYKLQIIFLNDILDESFYLNGSEEDKKIKKIKKIK